jgi:GxxExxY protein
MTENELSYIIRSGIFEVYNNLGPGLLESVYQHILKYELEKRGLKVKMEVALPLVYDNKKFDIGFRLDLLVEDKVIIELKSVENIAAVHHKQVLTYLRLTNLKLGILVNFNTAEITKSIYRKVNNL